MKSLRPLILCGCTADTANHCAHKSWVGKTCLCPCHYTQEQTQRLVSAYIHNGEHQVAGYMKNLWMKKKESNPADRVPTVMAACGHERILERKLSAIAIQYIKQNECDLCRLKSGVSGVIDAWH